MTLIKSISGIRGTIGGKQGENLTPADIVEFSAAFGKLIQERSSQRKIVIGRDARISGEMVSGLVSQTLRGLGFEVLDLGLSTTPTVEMAVPRENAGGGIIITASHNPRQWNALKFLNEKGEFISAAEGERILKIIEQKDIEFALNDKIGAYSRDNTHIQEHIESILELPLVNTEAVKSAKYRIVVDCINSTGAISLVPLLEQMGCEVIILNGEVNGDFAHNPEPLPENLTQLSRMVTEKQAHLGVAVDPDVDRLAMVCEDGEMFGEEYTLVAVADYILKHKKGTVVSNLSSTRALREVAAKAGCDYHASAVGEVNVVEKMKAVNAVIGGEGNGGIIYPELHYGRDAMVGIALFLSHLATCGVSASRLKSRFPHYIISKNKIELTPDIKIDALLKGLEEKYKNQPLNTEDGLKIDLEEGWIHLRKSNTEPIIRIYTEGSSLVTAENLATKIKTDISEILKHSAV